MEGMKMWNEGPLVDGACPNENCSEHMIAVRYPATMEYINHLGVVDYYFDIAMRCSSCGSYYPPPNESQLEVEVTPVVRMRMASGRINNSDKLMMFLYLLARDWVPTGTIDKIIDYEMPAGEGRFTNGWLAAWAEDVAIRLRAEKVEDEPVSGESAARRDSLDQSPGGR